MSAGVGILGAAKADVRIMFGGIAFRAKRGPEPIGTIDIRAAALHLHGAFGGPMGIDRGLRRIHASSYQSLTHS